MLSKFSKCPRSAYLYRMFPNKSHAMNRGIVWHGGIDELTAWMIEEGEPRVSGDLAREYFDGFAADHPEFVLPAGERDAGRLMAWNWGEATVLDLDSILGHEIEVTVEIGGWLLRCRIDLVCLFGDYLQVKDYKTSLAMPSDEEVQRNFQALFYSLAVLEGKVEGSPQPLGAGLNEVEFVLEFPRYRDKEHGFLKTRRAAFSRKDIQDFKFDLEQILRQLEIAYESQEWPAVPGSHCSECPAQALCPIAADLRELPEISNEAEARQVAEQTDRLEALVKRNKAGLKGWVSENGTLFFGTDVAFDITPTERRKVDTDGLVTAAKRCAAFGEPFELEDFVKTAHGTKFQKRKRTEEERDAN